MAKQMMKKIWIAEMIPTNFRDSSTSEPDSSAPAAISLSRIRFSPVRDEWRPASPSGVRPKLSTDVSLAPCSIRMSMIRSLPIATAW